MSLTKDSMVRVRISSEDAGGIVLSAVQRRDVPLRELIGWIVAVTGKDFVRILEILRRGAFVKGLSRIRWEPFDASDALGEILALLPEDWPERPMVPHLVREIEIDTGRRRIALRGELARKRRWFRARSFLEAWLESEELPSPGYQAYDFEEKADRYAAAVPGGAHGAFLRIVELLPSREYRNALRASVPAAIRLYLPRE